MNKEKDAEQYTIAEFKSAHLALIAGGAVLIKSTTNLMADETRAIAVLAASRAE
jgi:hypothetical protein